MGYNKDYDNKNAAQKSSGGSDWIGYGMQIGGAMIDRADEKKAREREERLYREKIAREQIENSKNRMFDERARMDDLALKQRSQNMQGLQMLDNMVEGNRQAARRMPSFREALLSAGY